MVSFRKKNLHKSDPGKGVNLHRQLLAEIIFRNVFQWKVSFWEMTSSLWNRIAGSIVRSPVTGTADGSPRVFALSFLWNEVKTGCPVSFAAISLPHCMQVVDIHFILGYNTNDNISQGWIVRERITWPKFLHCHIIFRTYGGRQCPQGTLLLRHANSTLRRDWMSADIRCRRTGGLTRESGMTEEQRALWTLSSPVCSEYNVAVQEFWSCNPCNHSHSITAQRWVCQ